MDKRKAAATAALALLMITALTARPGLAREAVSQAVNTCLYSLIPALFPFLFAVDLLQSALLFVISSPSLSVLTTVFCSFVGGYGTGARAVARLVFDGVLDPDSASLLLCGCINSGPAFVVGAVGLGILGASSAGYVLLAALSCSSLTILAFLYRYISAGMRGADAKSLKRTRPDALASLSAALKSISGIRGVCLVYSCFFPYFSYFIHDRYALWALSAAAEVVLACRSAGELPYAVYFLGASLSLCSFSIISQVKSLTKSAGISLKPFLLSRIFHLALTLGFIKLFCLIFNRRAETLYNANGAAAQLSVSPLFAVALLLFCASVVYSLKKDFDNTAGKV